jgi:gamma-glutamyltranspeptidase/glutathione hydrolase
LPSATEIELARSLAPAIRLAEEGFAADALHAAASVLREAQLKKCRCSQKFFSIVTRRLLPVSSWFNPTGRDVAHAGRPGGKSFYHGKFARKMAQTVKSAGGLWELADLENYRVIERTPLKFTYRGARITAAPLPSSRRIGIGAKPVYHAVDTVVCPWATAALRGRGDAPRLSRPCPLYG